MINDQQNHDKLNLYDILIMFMLKAPDQKKAITALEGLFGVETMKLTFDYKRAFKSYLDWHNHLVVALANARAKVK